MAQIYELIPKSLCKTARLCMVSCMGCRVLIWKATYAHSYYGEIESIGPDC